MADEEADLTGSDPGLLSGNPILEIPGFRLSARE